MLACIGHCACVRVAQLLAGSKMVAMILLLLAALLLGGNAGVLVEPTGKHTGSMTDSFSGVRV